MPPSSRFRRRRWLLWTALCFVVLVFGVPLLLSPLAKSAINRKLATLSGYQAQVGGVRIAVWKLALDLDDFVLSDKAHLEDGPLLKIGHGKMTLLPGALIRGRISAHGSISDTELLIIQDEPKVGPNDSKEEKDKKAKERAKKARDWQRQLQESFSIEISHFEITRTKIRFVDRSMPGNPEMTIGDLNLVAKNLKTRADSSEELPAHIEVTGRFVGGGTLRADAALAPLEAKPRFKTSLEVKELQLPALHDFLQAYANVDVHKGTFEVFIEAEARDGHYSGYVKPFFRDLEFKAVPDPEKGFIRNTATKVASAVTNLLKNDEQKVATKVPFQGDFDNADVDIWATVENLLRNAFVQSLREGFEGQKPNG